MQPLSFFSRPGGQSLRFIDFAPEPLEPIADVPRLPVPPVVPSMLMLVVLVALLPAVLPLPLTAPLLLVLPPGVTVLPALVPPVPPAVGPLPLTDPLPLVLVSGEGVVLPAVLPVRPDRLSVSALVPVVPVADVPLPRLVVVLNDPLVPAEAPALLSSVPVEEEVCAIAPAAKKPATSRERSLLMCGIPSCWDECILLEHSPATVQDSSDKAGRRASTAPVGEAGQCPAGHNDGQEALQP
jgi:hypothetical protein